MSLLKRINWPAIGRALLFVTAIASILFVAILMPVVADGAFLTWNFMLLVAASCFSFSLICYGLTKLWQHLSVKLGRITALAGVVGGVAVVGAAVALSLPNCPGLGAVDEGTRCEPHEAASWGVSLAMMVIVVGGAYLLAAGFANRMKKFHGIVQDAKIEAEEEKEEEELQKQVEEGRKKAKNRNPQEKKGYPTPKQKKHKKQSASNPIPFKTAGKAWYEK